MKIRLNSASVEIEVEVEVEAELGNRSNRSLETIQITPTNENKRGIHRILIM